MDFSPVRIPPLSPEAMHIPDGFLSLPVALLCWGLAIAAIALAVRHTRRTLGERQVPLMGVMAAFIFAAQMLNFTVAGGTSGHLIGGALAAILLGPWAATLVMTAVVGMQALFFQDGGLITMGANLLNMAIIAPWVGYAVWTVVRRLGGARRWSVALAGFAGGWLSVELAAILCALQLALSGTSPLSVALPAMGFVHALIGTGEGLITAAVLLFVQTAEGDLIPTEVAR